MLFEEHCSHFAGRVQELSHSLGVSLDRRWGRREFKVLGGTEIYGEGKRTADGNEASRQVGARYWSGVPSVDKKQDGLKCHPNRLSFVGHDAQAFVQEAVHALH